MTGLGFSEAEKIYINKSLTQKNKGYCLKTAWNSRKYHSYEFLWTNAGKIFLKRNADS